MKKKASRSVSLVYHPPTYLNILVTDNGRKLMRDKMKIPKLNEKALGRINIPGFGFPQIKDLCLLKKTTWRHLGLDYQVEAEQERLSWGLSHE